MCENYFKKLNNKNVVKKLTFNNIFDNIIKDPQDS